MDISTVANLALIPVRFEIDQRQVKMDSTERDYGEYCVVLSSRDLVSCADLATSMEKGLLLVQAANFLDVREYCWSTATVLISKIEYELPVPRAVILTSCKILSNELEDARKNCEVD